MDALILSLLFAIVFAAGYYLPPHERGFWSQDPAIQSPFVEPMFGFRSILVFSLIFPSLVIAATKRLFPPATPAPGSKARTKGTVGPSLWSRFLLSVIVNIALMMFFKLSVGRLRPHFLSACQPNVDLTVDRFYSSSEYSCRQASAKILWNSRQSFYSGHASLALGAGVFLVLMIQDHVPRSLIRSAVQICLLLIGLFPGVTQIQCNWHHESDVLAGYLMGTLVSVGCYFAV